MPRQSKSKPPARLPQRFLAFQREFPRVFAAYEALGEAAQAAGPLAARERALVKLALAIGAGLEGAVHAHARRALEAGCTAADVRHVAVLATTTLGFPRMMATLSWVDDVLARAKKTRQ